LGRTNPTFRDQVRGIENRWGDYRRALRRADKPHFDRLFEHARAHADAAGYLNHGTPEIPILVSVLLEQEKRLEELEARLSDREARLADADAGGADETADE
jgi:hypothetical protein